MSKRPDLDYLERHHKDACTPGERQTKHDCARYASLDVTLLVAYAKELESELRGIEAFVAMDFGISADDLHTNGRATSTSQDIDSYDVSPTDGDQEFSQDDARYSEKKI